MSGYDHTPAGFARHVARAEERLGNKREAREWRKTSWGLWDRQSSLRVDPDDRAYPHFSPVSEAAVNAHSLWSRSGE